LIKLIKIFIKNKKTNYNITNFSRKEEFEW